jgi:hypothetical protein
VSQIYGRLQEPEFLADLFEIVYQWEFTNWDDFQPKYSLSAGRYEEFTQHMRVARILNHTCEFINKGIIDPKFISETVAIDIIHYWEKFGPMIRIGRQIVNNPLAFDDIEKVYPRLKQQYQQRIDALQRTL